MKKLLAALFLLTSPVLAQRGGDIHPLSNVASSCLATSGACDASKAWCVDYTNQKAYACNPFTKQWVKFAELDTANVPTNVATADALSSNGANCSLGSAPLGVDTHGNAEGCTSYQPLDAELSSLANATIGTNGQIWKSNGSVASWQADSTGGSPSYDTIASGTSTQGPFICDTGCDNHAVNGGVIKASDLACTTCVNLLTEVGPFSSADFAATVTDETGTGKAVMDTAPTLSNPVVGTQTANDSSTKAASTAYVQTELAAFFSDSGTLTSKTFDAEGTGNTLAVPVKVWLPAAGCQASTASSFWDNLTANPAVAACVTGTNTQKGVLDFDASTNQFAQATVLLPGDWVGTADVKFLWFAAATSGNVIWGIQTICVADAETDDPAFNTASTVTDAAKGTTLQLNAASVTGFTTTGCAAGELMHINIYRDAANGSDTMAGNARLIGVEITLRRSI